MSDDILSKLNQAFDHVEAGRLDEAIAILTPVLDAAPDNADAWWIYLHAVSDPVEARRALQNVLRIAPDYPGASEMLAVLDVQSPTLQESPAARPAIKPLSPPPMSMPEAPPGMPEAPISPVTETRPKFEEVAQPVPPSSPERRRSMLPTFIIAAVVVIAILLVAALLLPGMQTPSAATATTVVAADATETTIPVQAEASATSADTVIAETDEAADRTASPDTAATEAVVEPSPTSEIEGTAEATSDVASDGVDAALASFALAPDGITNEEIADTPTVVANVCSTPGREVRTLLPQVMEALASASDSLPEDAGIGTRLINCSDGTTLVTVVASRESVEEYANGTLSASEFASGWTPVR